MEAEGRMSGPWDSDELVSFTYIMCYLLFSILIISRQAVPKLLLGWGRGQRNCLDFTKETLQHLITLNPNEGLAGRKRKAALAMQAGDELRLQVIG